MHCKQKEKQGKVSGWLWFSPRFFPWQNWFLPDLLILDLNNQFLKIKNISCPLSRKYQDQAKELLSVLNEKRSSLTEGVRFIQKKRDTQAETLRE